MCFDPVIPLLENYSKEINKDVLKTFAEKCLNSTLFIIEKNVNNPNVHTLCYSYSGILCSLLQ